MVTDVGGTNGLVSLLGALAGRAIMTHLEVALADVLLDFLADGSQRQIAQIHRVGTHVSDQAFLIETLREAHGLLHRQSQLAGSLLLEGTRREGRSRCALHGLHSHVSNLEVRLLAVLQEGVGLLMVLQMTVQLGRERLAVGIGELR